MRAVSSEGHGRIKYYKKYRELLNTDRGFRRYAEGESTELPPFFRENVKRDLGQFWSWLPEGALEHDPNAYLKAENSNGGLVSLTAQAGAVRKT